MASGIERIHRAIHWESSRDLPNIDFHNRLLNTCYNVIGLGRRRGVSGRLNVLSWNRIFTLERLTPVKGICRLFLVLLVLGFSLAFAGGFYGNLITTEGDTLYNARITAKTGSTVVNETYSDEDGRYQISWSTNRISPALSRPFLSIGNNVSYDGTLFAFVDQPENCGYSIIDITGRDVTHRGRYAGGMYFLRVYDKTTGDIVGTQKFISFSPRIHVEFQAVPRTYILQKASDNDSLIVEYPHDDMCVATYREHVTLPENLEEKHIILNRTRREPTIEFTQKPDTLTIDTLYTLTTHAYNKDYDANITSIKLENIIGETDTINHENNTLTIKANKGQEYTLQFRITDDQQGNNLENLKLNIQSDKYTIILTKLFHGLGQPRENLTVTLKNKTKTTKQDGKAEFHYPIGTLTKNLGVRFYAFPPEWEEIRVPYSTDSIYVTDNILGTLQEGTGPFAEMHFDINPQAIDNGGIYAIETIFGPVMMDSKDSRPDTIQTITEPLMQQNPDYWNDYVWANQLEREFYLLGLDYNHEKPYIFPQWGSVKEGRTHLYHYSPEYYAEFDYGRDSIDYRLQTRIVIDTLSQAINKIAKDQNNNGKTPYNIINLSESQDSMKAIQKGNTFDFTKDYSQLKYANYEQDEITGIWYINNAGEYVMGGAASPSIQRVMAHELGRAVNYSNITPYGEEKIPDIMRNGQLQPHDYYGFYFTLNADPKIFQKITDKEKIMPIVNFTK